MNYDDSYTSCEPCSSCLKIVRAIGRYGLDGERLLRQFCINLSFSGLLPVNLVESDLKLLPEQVEARKES